MSISRAAAVVSILVITAIADARTEEKASFGPDELSITAVAFSPDGKWFASASYDNRNDSVEGTKARINIYDVASWTVKRTLKIQANSLRFSPDGKLLAIGSAIEDLFIYDVASGKETVHFELKPNPTAVVGPRKTGHGNITISSMELTRDGKLLAAAYGVEVVVWDVAASKLKVRLDTKKYSNQPVIAVAVSPDGKLVATTGPDATTELWKLPSGEHHGTIEGEVGDALAFSPDGKSLAMGKSVIDRVAIVLCDVATLTKSRELDGQHRSVYSLAFSPDGKKLATAGAESFVKVWYLDKKDAKPAQLIGHSGAISSVAWSPDGKLVAGGGQEDKLVKTWEVPDAK